MEFVGQKIARGVTDSDDLRSGGDSSLDGLAEELAVTAAGVLRHEFHFRAALRACGHHPADKG